MTNDVSAVTPPSPATHPVTRPAAPPTGAKPETDAAVAAATDATVGTEAESLAQLRGDCARMAPHWKAERCGAPAPGTASDLHGVRVPAASAALLLAMSDYGG